METGIFIRAMINGKAESIDIGDPRLTVEQLLHWLIVLQDNEVLITLDKVRERWLPDAANTSNTTGSPTGAG